MIAMTILYLITHAHTEQRPDIDATSWTLSESGRAQAARLAEEPFWSTVTRAALSSEPKTRLTLEPVLRTRPISVMVDARLDELRRTPKWIDDYVGHVAQVFASPNQSIGGWETAATAQARFLAGIEALHRKFKGQTVALVGHGLTLSLYRAHLLRQDHVDIHAWRSLSFAAVAQVDLNASRLVSDFRPVAGTSMRG